MCLDSLCRGKVNLAEFGGYVQTVHEKYVVLIWNIRDESNYLIMNRVTLVGLYHFITGKTVGKWNT